MQDFNANSTRSLRRLPAFSRPIAAVVSATVLLCAGSVLACNIPVFRYALERWRPDACQVIVYHRDSLSEDERRLIDRWQSQCAQRGGPANAEVVVVPVTSSGEASAGSPELGAVLDKLVKLDNVSFPYVVVRSEIGGKRYVSHWHGQLAEFNDAKLMSSPARAELARRLTAGHSIVWLILNSDDDVRNSEVKSQIEDVMERVADSVTLPEGIGLPGSELYSEVPLVVRFSTLVIGPDDPDEVFLTQLLKAFYPDAVRGGEPLVVPVFGRGRALEVIPASQFSPVLMEDLAQFLSAACSCQVKDQNPGFDLLLSNDWDRELFGEDGVRPPPDAGAGTNRRPEPVLLPIPPGRKGR